MVRGIAVECHGYELLVANDGTEALAIYAEHKKETDVVLTDMVMSHMDGAATIRALQKMNPAVSIIATSRLQQINCSAETVGETAAMRSNRDGAENGREDPLAA